MSPLVIILIVVGVTLLILLILAFLGYWIPKWPTMLILEKVFPTVQTRFSQPENSLALTFDDVPHSKESFSDLLQILNEHSARATFFVISGQVDSSNRHLLIQALQDGHQLANHGKTDSMHVRKSVEEFQEEFNHCHQLLMELYREAKVPLPAQMFYRPGCGWFNRTMLKYIDDQDYRLALGSVYPNDPHVRHAGINLFYLRPHLQSGDIVILHDRKWTPPLIKRLLPWIHEKGWTTRTLDQFT